MSIFPTNKLLACLLAGFMFHGSAGWADYDELLNGDLSDTPLQPTLLRLGNRDTRVSGTLGNGNRDYFTFTVEEGKRINSVQLANLASNDELAWIALQRGTLWSAGARTSQMVAFQLLGPDEVGKLLLGITSRRPLLPGNYTISLQHAGAPSDFALIIGYEPLLSTSATLKTFFTWGGRPSTAQYIILQGTGLRSRVTAKAPFGFEVSVDNKTYGKSASFDPLGGDLRRAKLFVRAAPLNRLGNISGRLEITSEGAQKLQRPVVLKAR